MSDDRPRSSVRAKGQLTLPAEIRRRAHLEEGDLVEFEVAEGVILLRPLKVVDPEQWWFWTEAWQEGEREATDEIRSGRGTVYESTAAFLEALEERSR